MPPNGRPDGPNPRANRPGHAYRHTLARQGGAKSFFAVIDAVSAHARCVFANRHPEAVDVAWRHGVNSPGVRARYATIVEPLSKLSLASAVSAAQQAVVELRKLQQKLPVYAPNNFQHRMKVLREVLFALRYARRFANDQWWHEIAGTIVGEDTQYELRLVS